MLNIIFGFQSKALRNTAGYIRDYAVKSDTFVPGSGLPPEVVEGELEKYLIKEIDKSVVHHARWIESPVLGTISYRELSHGVQGLIILANTPEIIPFEFMGDNCFKYLAEISRVRDVNVCTGSFRDLYHHGFIEGKDIIHVVNDDTYVNNGYDLMRKYFTLEMDDYGEYAWDKRVSYNEAYGIDDNLDDLFKNFKPRD